MFGNGFEHMKIETHVLKVQINCQGCKKKVQKMLRKIEGVYSVNIYAEQQLVIVSGCVDSATLIKRFVKSGKHAELWSAGSSSRQNQEQPDLINNQMQHPSPTHGFNFSQNQRNTLPAYFGNEIEDLGSFGNYLGHNNGIEALDGEMGQTLMASASMHNDMALASMISPAAYQGSDAGYAGLSDREINRLQDYAAMTNPPSRMLADMGDIYHNNHASTYMPSSIYWHY